MIRRILIVFVVLTSAPLALAENWPSWRGPRGDGTSFDLNVPTEWNAEANLNLTWKTDIPYAGHSSPIVWNDRIFVTGADENRLRRMLMAFHRQTGELLWERAVSESPLEHKHKLNSWASGTCNRWDNFSNPDNLHSISNSMLEPQPA